MADEVKKSLKLKRRGAKARVTRFANGLQMLLDANREKSEVQGEYDRVQQAYEELQKAHEEYAMTVDDDVFDEEEKWMSDCQSEFSKLKMAFHDHCTQTSQQSQSHSRSSSPPPLAAAGSSQSCFKMEKPKLPRFVGDVRDYCVFRSDFKHLIDCRYTKRDAITILRSCLQGRPLELIRGIGSDYDAAWEQLESVYGDPRFVADAIINDINKFRALKENEDGRFCELVNLVRRSYNTLKEVGCGNDMDNSNVLALIERKLSVDDRKVWFRYQGKEQDPVSMQMLLQWLTDEMKARIRSAAPLRNDTRQASINHMSQPRE